MRQALAHAMQGCDELYLSIDIDAMDAGYLPGTGSIVHSGITPRQYYDLLDGLAEARPCRRHHVRHSSNVPNRNKSQRSPYT